MLKIKNSHQDPTVAKVQSDLERIPSKTFGLNIDRIEGYFRDRNLNTSPFTVIGRETIQEVQNILKNAGCPADIAETVLAGPDAIGLYHEQIDWAFVIRDFLKPSFRTEKDLVHELAHSIIKEDTRIYIPSFLDEGFAESEAGNYALLYTSTVDGGNYERQLIEKARIDQQDGATKNLNLNSIPLEQDGSFHPPLKYWDITAGELEYTGPVWAAWGTEILSMSNSNFKDILKERNDPHVLQELPRIINSISPGLYKIIQKAPYTMKGFRNATLKIIERVYKKGLILNRSTAESLPPK